MPCPFSWGGWSGMPWDMSWGMGFMWPLAAALWLIFIGLIIVGVYLVIKAFTESTSRETRTDALETLKKRYAKGEISREQYLEMKKDLE